MSACYTVAEVAAKFDTTERTVRRWAELRAPGVGELAVYAGPRTIRFPREGIDALIAKRRALCAD